MSRHETPMLEAFWQRVGGLLITEFPLVLRSTNRARRLADGIILSNEETRNVRWRDVRNKLDLSRTDVVIVQVKASRLGMAVMGQAIFSAELLRRRFSPRSVRSVILCTDDDAELRTLLGPYHVEVVALPQFRKRRRIG